LSDAREALRGTEALEGLRADFFFVAVLGGLPLPTGGVGKESFGFDLGGPEMAARIAFFIC
jgi:hypothetical protein